MSNHGASVKHVVEICVCTYRRPQIRQTLESLAAQELPDGVSATVLVVDNDDTPSAHEIVACVSAAASIPIRLVHSPGANISIARNSALENATAPLIAFIDDDEVATPGWLSALLGEMDRAEATAVLGPVSAIYKPGAPGWMLALDIHSTKPVWVRGEIRAGYTCNALIDRSAPGIEQLRFDPALGRAGGEDTAYFAALVGAGGRISYAEDAVVYEEVAAERLATRWLLRRRFRMGQTHGRLLRGSGGPLRRLGQFALAGAKLSYCLTAAGLGAFVSTRGRRALLRGVLHAGVISGLAGARELQLYSGEPGQMT